MVLATPAAAQLHVTDGDTIRWDEERIRLETIDAPDIGQPECLAERLLGLAATRRLAEILTGPGAMSIERSGVDWFGRTLAIVRMDGVDVGEILVAEGYAVPWTGHQADWCH